MQNPFSAPRRQWLWPVIVAALIFLASSRSELAGPSVPGIDKVTHFGVYGLLGTLVVRLGRRRRSAWIALLLVSAYGITDEWHQSFTPGRSVELADWIADTLGAGLAILMYRQWAWYRNRLETPLRAKRRIENAPPAATVSTP